MSSWMFGDGAVLFNQASVASFSPSRMTSLDDVLTSASGDTGGGLSFGGAVGRALNNRVSIEGNLDLASGVTLNGVGEDGIEATRRSFQTAFGQLLAHFGADTAPPLGASAASTITQSGRETRLIGLVNVRIGSIGRLETHLTGGGGFALRAGDGTLVTLRGEYEFLAVFPSVRIHETDTVTFRLRAGNGPVGVVGGGMRVSLSPRMGLRADVRALVSPHKLRIALDAAPASLSAVPAGTRSFGIASPAIQFSSSGDFPSSLSGPAITDFETFSGTGIATQVRFTFGIFMRL